MNPLLADDIAALPWPYVLALCGALGGAIVVMWKRDVNREGERASREKEIADLARTDGLANGKQLADAAAAMTRLAERFDASDEERRVLVKDIMEQLQEMRETVARCGVRP